MRKTGTSEGAPILVDSCGWVEYLSDGPKAAAYARHIEGSRAMVTSPIVIYEVYKRLRTAYDEDMALKAVAHIQERSEAVPFDASLALIAADISAEERIPMADAIILATARAKGARLVTGDEHFKELDGVTFV